jgi:hypothetical protein
MKGCMNGWMNGWMNHPHSALCMTQQSEQREYVEEEIRKWSKLDIEECDVAVLTWMWFASFERAVH